MRKVFKSIAYKTLCCFCCMMIFTFTIICNTKPFKASALTGVDDATIAAGAVAILACIGIYAGFQYASKNDMSMTDGRVWAHVGNNIQNNLKTLAGGLQTAGKTLINVGSDCINGVKSAMKSFVDDYKTYNSTTGQFDDNAVPTGINAGFTNQTAVNIDQGQTWNWKNSPSSVFFDIPGDTAGTWTKNIGKTAVKLVVDSNHSTLTLTLSSGVILTSMSGLNLSCNSLGKDFIYQTEYYIQGGANALHFKSDAAIGNYGEWHEYEFSTWNISNYGGASGQLMMTGNQLQIWEGGTTFYNIGTAAQYKGVENFLYNTLVDEQELPAPSFTITKAAYDDLSVPATADTTIAVPGATEDSVAQSIDVANAVPSDVVPDFNLTYDMSIPELIFTKKFPFSIPYDCFSAVKNLVVPSQAPVFVFPLNIKGVVNQNITVDMTQVSPLVAILRWGLSLLFIIGLIVVTRKLIGA